MQTRTTAQNLIYTGRYPYNNPGPQTDRHIQLPPPSQPPTYTTGPNDITNHNFIISLRTLTPYNGSDEPNTYLMRLPTIIDRPINIQFTGHTMGHLDNTTTGLGIKTIILETSIVKQSGYYFERTDNTTVTASDGVAGIIRVPHANSTSQIFTIATTQVLVKVPIKEQGYSTLTGIPIRFLNNKGTALSIEKDGSGDLSADGELMFQIGSLTYNPAIRNRMALASTSVLPAMTPPIVSIKTLKPI